MMNDDLDRVVPLDQLDDFKVADGDPDVRGWDVIAADGRKIGEVDQLLVDTAAMKVRYLDVDVENELLGGASGNTDRHVLIPIGYARLDEGNDRVIVDQLASSEIVGLPEYTHGPVTRDFETDLRTRFDTSYTAGATGLTDAGTTGTASTDTGRDFYSGDLYDDNRFYGSRRGLENDEARLTLSEEELVVKKRQVEETETVEADLRRERADVDRQGDVRLRENDRLGDDRL